MDTNALLDALKARLNLPSDYALAKFFRCTQESIRKMRERGLSDERVLQIAALLDIDPGEPLAAIRAERAKDPAVKSAWRKVAESVRTALGVFVPGIMAAAVVASSSGPAVCILCKIARRWLQRLAPALVLLFAAPAHAADWFTPLTHADRIRLGAYYATHVIDWGQTLYIADHPAEYRETNTFLPAHPTRGEVNRYFVAVGLLHYSAVRALPRAARPWFQYITIGWNTAIIANNVQLGIRVDF